MAATKVSTSTKKKAAPKAKAKETRCWEGFEPTPGKEPGAKGSCKPKG